MRPQGTDRNNKCRPVWNGKTLQLCQCVNWIWGIDWWLGELKRPWGGTSNPRWPTLITHSQGQESNEDRTPLEQLDGTTLFLGHAEPREGGWGQRGEGREGDSKRWSAPLSPALLWQTLGRRSEAAALQQWHLVEKDRRDGTETLQTTTTRENNGHHWSGC